jgi:hypothetical protein
MRKHILATGIALAALIPSVATAQTSCERQRSGRVAATVGGAAAGGALGAVVAGKGDRVEGGIIGGVLGAIAGNQIAKPDQDCRRAYGWYDRDGRWHATGVSSANARGYFDRNGDWVEGRPAGYYDGDRWVAYNADPDSYGYWDRNGYYVPATATGYYDRNGRWVAAEAPGYYDQRGRWVASPARGYYDSRGRWVSGETRLEQPGYWSNGRWIAGTTRGYYDSRGRWVSIDNRTGMGGPYEGASGGYDWNNQPTDAMQRIQWLRNYIRDAGYDNRLTSAERRYADSELGAIESQHRLFMQSGGTLTVREEARTDMRLDRLTRRLDRDRY